MKIFHHNDLDGRCAAFWVLDYHRDDNPECIPIDYRDRFPIETIEPNEIVYIVDFSIEPETMRALLEVTKNVTWIDHHKTAIEKYADFEHDIKGLRKDGTAGCVLTCMYLHNFTEETVPYFTRLIGDRDVWKFEFGERTKEFCAGLGLYDTAPTSEIWKNIFKQGELLDLICREGQTIIKYQAQTAADYLNRFSYEIEFEGHQAIVCNIGGKGSDFFESCPRDISIAYVFDGNQYIVNLRSETVDVSEIAKKYGGGGHEHASGFQCKALPFSGTSLRR